VNPYEFHLSDSFGANFEITRLVKKALLFLLVLSVSLATSMSYSEPTASRAEITSTMPGDLKRKVEALYSPKPIDRVVAVLEIKGMGRKAVSAIPFLIALLGDSTAVELGPTPSTWTCAGIEAARVLVKLGVPSVEPLIDALKDKEPLVRQRAAWVLGEIKDPRAIEPLIGALKDDDFIVRGNAASALRRITKKDFGKDPGKWQRWWDGQELKRPLLFKTFIEMLRASRSK
jgi:hypothetical protein